MAGYLGTKAVLLSTTAASVGGDATISGDLTVDTNTLYVDSTNNRVGIGNASPAQTLDVTGDIVTSGGVYLGGTGSANYLDDYEDGTFTPSIVSYYGNNPVINYYRQYGSYIKVGKLVQVVINIDINSASNLSSDLIMVGPLPFTIRASEEADGVSNVSSFSPVRGNHISIGLHSITQYYMGFLTSNNGVGWGWEATSIMPTGSSALRVSMTYKTD